MYPAIVSLIMSEWQNNGHIPHHDTFYDEHAHLIRVSCDTASDMSRFTLSLLLLDVTLLDVYRLLPSSAFIYSVCREAYPARKS